jgi:hypothetical protein
METGFACCAQKRSSVVGFRRPRPPWNRVTSVQRLGAKILTLHRLTVLRSSNLLEKKATGALACRLKDHQLTHYLACAKKPTPPNTPEP